MAAKYSLSLVLLAVLTLSGCVEKQLTVKTVPDGGVVVLNDEEIGAAPVTTSFQWYGDYSVRISKPGYQTLVTHKKLDRPLDDKFPFDFFAGVLWPGTIKHHYEWTFELEPYKAPNRQELINSAIQLRADALNPAVDPNTAGSTKANKPQVK